MKPQPSDPINGSISNGWMTQTPNKSSNPPHSIKHHSHSQLPEKYEILLRFFDALEASLRLLRLRKSIPLFSKIRVSIEKISDRRFTHCHLGQLKYLLSKEMSIKRVLMPDDETRCMKYDLHVSCNSNLMNNIKKRKRGSKFSCLRNRFLSRLWQFIRAHPEGTEIPKEELPEPFNGQEQDIMLETSKDSSLHLPVQKGSDNDTDLQPIRASHFSRTFKKCFSKGNSGVKLEGNYHTLSDSSLGSSPNSVPKPSVYEDDSKSVAVDNNKTCTSKPEQLRAEKTPTKLGGTPKFVVATPALQTPKRSSLSTDRIEDQPSCARSLRFDGCPHVRNLDIEVQLDETECASNIIDILPSNLLQSLREKGKSEMEESQRKLLITRLPKLFDRIHYLCQTSKSSSIRKEALVRDLTERHHDITDESEVEKQLSLLQEIIPEWISNKLSPSGNTIYSINKRLNANTLRSTLEKVM